MPRYDPDDIAALAEGRLDPETAAALERDITIDPVAAAELAAQRSALDAVSEATRPELTMSERSDLHSAVADALGITAPEFEETQRSRRVPWGSLGIAAATLVGLVAVVPLVGLLSTDGDDVSASASFELAPEAPTTTVAAAEPEQQRSAAAEGTEEAGKADEVSEAAPAIVAEVDEDDALRVDEDVDNGVATFGSSTTLPRATTTTPPPDTTTTLDVTESSTTTSEVAPSEGEEIEQLAAELGAIRSDTDVSAIAEGVLEETACWAEDNETRPDPSPQLFFFEYERDQLAVIVYFELTEGEVGPFQVWSVPACANLVVIP